LSIEDEIKEYAREIGAAAVGITGPERLDEALPIYRRRIERGYLTGFEERDLELRLDPARSLAGVQSVISLAVPYNVDYVQSTTPKFSGQIARVAWGRDYHAVVSEKMAKLSAFLKDRFAGLKCAAMVDSGPLMDRVIAWRAGLGWFGKNNTLIVPRVGSWVFLGELLIDKRLRTDSPTTGDCGQCEECLKACPTKALVEPYMLNGKICLSYLTQTADQAPDQLVRKMGRRVYGCDICQEVCPYNKAAPKIGDKAFTPHVLDPRPDLIDLISMDQRRFEETVNQTSAGWVGRSVIQRNAIIALADYKDPDTLPIVEKLQADDRPLISNASRWAEKAIRGETSL